jgi:hypothetical protein
MIYLYSKFFFQHLDRNYSHFDFCFSIVTILNVAYKQIHIAYNATLDYFSSKDEDTNWIIPVLVTISNDLRFVAGMVCYYVYKL